MLRLVIMVCVLRLVFLQMLAQPTPAQARLARMLAATITPALRLMVFALLLRLAALSVAVFVLLGPLAALV